MQIYKKVLEFPGTDGMDIHDVTDEIRLFLQETASDSGLLNVFTPGSTAGVTTIEYETGALDDLRRAMEQLAPRHAEYQHNLRWGDGNGYSHVRSALLGPSLTLPVESGAPALGTWQQVVVCDFDNRARQRSVVLQFMGSG